MTAIELKQHLKHRIEEINDEIFLNAIKTILDSKSMSQTLSLNKAQRNEISESKVDIDEGRFIDQAGMDKEFNQWLNAK